MSERLKNCHEHDKRTNLAEFIYEVMARVKKTKEPERLLVVRIEISSGDIMFEFNRRGFNGGMSTVESLHRIYNAHIQFIPHMADCLVSEAEVTLDFEMKKTR